MDKRNQTEYLNDLELEALIAQVEGEELLVAPSRLKGDILSAIEVEEKRVVRKKERTKQQRLLFYSAKIVLTSAAALLLLVVVPTEFNSSNNSIYTGIQAFNNFSSELGKKSNKISKKLFEYSYKQNLKEDYQNDKKEK